MVGVCGMDERGNELQGVGMAHTNRNTSASDV